MKDSHSLFDSLRSFDRGNGGEARFYSLPALEEKDIGPISSLPVCLRIILESVLRNYDGNEITENHVRALANWQPNGKRTDEVPFNLARILCQDFTGVPLVVDLAAMRSTMARLGKDPAIIEPIVPVDLIIDHSVQTDFAGVPDAFNKNLELEFKRNAERYRFLKWGTSAFKSFNVIPPAIGIIHQVNLEFLAKGVIEKNNLCFPDTLAGTDSHTTMINGLGIVAWGVGGIEAEAGMLGQPLYFLTPDVVGVHLTGSLPDGTTATDAALRVTEMLRKENVVGKFVEFYGPGAEAMHVVDRATIANMSPEYGATMGFFPVDSKCVDFLNDTGRSEEHCRLYENYYKSQGMFGIPRKGQIRYSKELELELTSVTPSVSGPKRPQDRIELYELKNNFDNALTKSAKNNGFNKQPEELNACADITLDNNEPLQLKHGSVVIASITSCTNTSNPSLMLAAGLLAKKAVEKGLSINPAVKASLAPGSRVVTKYLQSTGLQESLDKLGFHLAGYGCMTCIGNSGPLNEKIEDAIREHELVTAAVLSGNRNFEARIHQNIRANFLMSPPLVVAFAIAGRINIDMSSEPIGQDTNGDNVFLCDIWPNADEISEYLRQTLKPETYRQLYSDIASQNPLWNDIPATSEKVFNWEPESTYIQEPPFFQEFGPEPPPITDIKGARLLGIFGDSITTDHISPAGAIRPDSPAGKFLISKGVEQNDFNSYGSRRGNDRIMTRGTFANVRIKNLMTPGIEGGVTKHQPTGEVMPIYDAAVKYAESKTPLVIVAGREYGTGSSRDWAAKGTNLLGVNAVIAQSFERIHRSNLVGMGVLPLQFTNEMSPESLHLDGTEVFDILGLEADLKPQQELSVQIKRQDGQTETIPVLCRIDTPIELEYYRHGGILQYVMRKLMKAEAIPE